MLALCEAHVRGKFDEWVYILKKSAVRSDFTAAGTQEAGEKLDILKMTPEEKARYKRYKDADKSRKSELYTAKQKGKAEGIEIGRAEEREIADKEIEKERQIADQKIADALQKAEAEKITIVLNAAKMGMSIDDIAKLTNLSHQQITEIINNQQQ